jgi:hypothetical protein
MAHMVLAEGCEEEASSNNDLDIVKSTRKGLADADKYIESKFTRPRCANSPAVQMLHPEQSLFALIPNLNLLASFDS